MKKIILGACLISMPAVAGGTAGGGGLGKEQPLELALLMADHAELLATIPDPGLEKTIVIPETYRRTRARLSVSETAPVTIEGHDLSVKSLHGGIVDLEEISQLVTD
ncbi:MAG: hypothetical protein M3Q07_23540 [Pseudobdellovibrionaceae bacterium]|nr:hypothetical protein [Pseudobdellovibrionaceae bacterium]